MGLQAEVCNRLEEAGIDAWFEEHNVLCVDVSDFNDNELNFFAAANDCLVNKEWGFLGRADGTARFVLCELDQEMDENDY